MIRTQLKLNKKPFTPGRAYDLIHYETLLRRRPSAPLTDHQLARLNLKEV
jgi:hypothetical protein